MIWPVKTFLGYPIEKLAFCRLLLVKMQTRTDVSHTVLSAVTKGCWCDQVFKYQLKMKEPLVFFAPSWGVFAYSCKNKFTRFCSETKQFSPC